jgi:hypothetical protein
MTKTRSTLGPSGHSAFQYIRGKARRALGEREIVRAHLAPHPVVLYFEGNLLTFSQAGKASSLDRADMNEHVAAAVMGLNKSEALLPIEPLHGTCCHFSSPNRSPRANGASKNSTSSMSLEKEPAGAFNKAQRLIE